MVRAAVSGAIDYSQADPTDIRWRIKHRLLLLETQRQEDQRVMDYRHRHWCAYLSHGGLTEESFADVKQHAGETLTDLQNIVFPWHATEKPQETKTEETEDQNSKIDPETEKLIARFKIWRQAQNTDEAAEK